MEEQLGGAIFEEREELMVQPEGGTPISRTAHFLKPTSDSASGPTLKVPSLSLSCETKWAMKVSFNGWQDPLRKWKLWVDKMHDLYHSVWKEAGIYEAIMNSVFKIRKNDDLILGLAERWCSETNTFFFPWGEATISLEDVLILGGFSVLGGPVFMPLETNDLVEVKKYMNNARKDIMNSKIHKVTHSGWLNHFMDGGLKFEHEAFLALWLSRFVFPGNVHDTISQHLFPIAIHLARGVKIALAPCFLASIYRDLSLLKETMAASAELEAKNSEDSYLAVTLWAPLRLVQVWAWERLPPLQPKLNSIDSCGLRLTRWHSIKNAKYENVRSIIKSSGESFIWRPYVIPVNNWLFPKFYHEEEIRVHNYMSGLDEEIELFVRCMRVSELVGIDCVEPYFPNRVAMQFGMDQDLPGWIPRSMETREMTWNNYNRPICDAIIYIPSRRFESDVTFRYMEWWKGSVFAPRDMIASVAKMKRSSRRSKRLQRVLENEQRESLTNLEKQSLVSEVATEGGNEANPESPNEDLVNIKHNEQESRSSTMVELPESELEARVSINNTEQESRSPTIVELPELELEARVSINHNEEEVRNSTIVELPNLELGARVSINHNEQESRRLGDGELRNLEYEPRVSRLESIFAALRARKIRLQGDR